MAFSGRLFDRRCQVTANGVTVNGDSAAGPGFRIVFNVTETITGDQQQCNVEIENLGESSRKQIEAVKSASGAPALRDLHLAAGYADANFLDDIFVGTYVRAFSDKLSTGWRTKISAADGHGAKYKVVNHAFEVGTTLDQILARVIAEIGVDGSNALAALADIHIDLKIVKNPIVLAGAARHSLNKLAAHFGFTWWVSRGKFFVEFDELSPRGDGILISEESGLINSVEPFVDHKLGSNANAIKFVTLLNGSLTPGRLLKVRSRTREGFFKVLKAQHTGDTRGNHWYSAIEALAVEGG